jgi:hypothetical protein
VYVYGEFFYRDAGAACPSDDCYGRAGIHRNTGTGWSFVWEQPEDWLLDTSHSWLSGVANGPLFVLNRGLSCEFYIIDPPSQDCAMDGAETVQDVFAVNSSLVFGIKGEKVVYWDGSTWGPYPAAYTPYEVQRIWADGESVFCAGPEGTVISLEGEDWRIHDTGTLTGFADIWGFGADDVWVAGGDTGLMHFDGTSWTEVEWPSLTDPEDSCQFEEFGEFWGADGILFFHTYDQLIMWDGVAFSVLGHWPAHMVETTDGPQCVGGIEITGIWGNSPDEVFLAVRDRSHLTEGCGMENILWWDGTEFHWF